MSQEIVVVDTENVCHNGVGAEHVIEYQTWGDGSPGIVMLHDGLGSIAQWRDTPQVIADQCGVAVVAYNRPGHGRSRPTPDGPWPTHWLHHQAELLGLLLAEWQMDKPMLVGHSDGGSIALLYAAGEGAGSVDPSARCRGVVSLAAHSFVEPICGHAIAGLRRDLEKMHAGLRLFHREPEALFAAWSGVWLSDQFSSWDIRPSLRKIEVPTWLAQGNKDEYGTEAQLWTTSEAIGAVCNAILLPDFGHLIHHQDSSTVANLVATAMAETS